MRLEEAYRDILRSLPPNFAEGNARLYPGYVLSEGLQNEDVRDLQTYLRGIAEYMGVIPIIPVTGYFGTQTRDVVSALQAQNGLPASGTVGSPTWNLIRRLYDAR